MLKVLTWSRVSCFPDLKTHLDCCRQYPPKKEGATLVSSTATSSSKDEQQHQHHDEHEPQDLHGHKPLPQLNPLVIPHGLGACFMPGVENPSLLDLRKSWLHMAKDIQPTYHMCCDRTAAMSEDEVRELYNILVHDDGDADGDQHGVGRDKKGMEDLEFVDDTTGHGAVKGTKMKSHKEQDEVDEDSTSKHHQRIFGRLFESSKLAGIPDDSTQEAWLAAEYDPETARQLLVFSDHTRVIYQKQTAALWHFKALLDYGDRSTRLAEVLPYLKSRGFRRLDLFDWFFRGISIHESSFAASRFMSQEVDGSNADATTSDDVLLFGSNKDQHVVEDAPAGRATTTTNRSRRTSEDPQFQPKPSFINYFTANNREEDVDHDQHDDNDDVQDLLDLKLPFLVNLAKTLEINSIPERQCLMEDLDTLQGPLRRATDRDIDATGNVITPFDPAIERLLMQNEKIVYDCDERTGVCSRKNNSATSKGSGTRAEGRGDFRNILEKQYNPWQCMLRYRGDDAWNGAGIDLMKPRQSTFDESLTPEEFAKRTVLLVGGRAVLNKSSPEALDPEVGDPQMKSPETLQPAILQPAINIMLEEVRRVDFLLGSEQRIPEDFRAMYNHRYLPAPVEEVLLLLLRSKANFGVADFVRMVIEFFEGTTADSNRDKQVLNEAGAIKNASSEQEQEEQEDARTGKNARTSREHHDHRDSSTLVAQEIAEERNAAGKRENLPARFLVYWIWLERISFSVLLGMSKPLAVAVFLMRLKLMRGISLCRATMFALQAERFLENEIKTSDSTTTAGNYNDGSTTGSGRSVHDGDETTRFSHPELRSIFEDLQLREDENMNPSTSQPASSTKKQLHQSWEKRLLQRLLEVLRKHYLSGGAGTNTKSYLESVTHFFADVCRTYGRGSRLVWKECGCQDYMEVRTEPMNAGASTSSTSRSRNTRSKMASSSSSPSPSGDDPGTSEVTQEQLEPAASCGDLLHPETAGSLRRKHHYYSGYEYERSDSIAVEGSGEEDEGVTRLQTLEWSGRVPLGEDLLFGSFDSGGGGGNTSGGPASKAQNDRDNSIGNKENAKVNSRNKRISKKGRVTIDVVIPVCAQGDVDDLDISVFPGWSRLFFYDLCGEFSRFLPPDEASSRTSTETTSIGRSGEEVIKQTHQQHPNTGTNSEKFLRTVRDAGYRLFSVADILKNQEGDVDEQRFRTNPLAVAIVERCAKFRGDSVFFDDSHEEDIRTLDTGVRFYHLAKHYDTVADIVFMAHPDWREHATTGIMQSLFESLERGLEWREEARSPDVVHMGKRHHGPLLERPVFRGKVANADRFLYGGGSRGEVVGRETGTSSSVHQMHSSDAAHFPDTSTTTGAEILDASPEIEGILNLLKDFVNGIRDENRDVVVPTNQHQQLQHETEVEARATTSSSAGGFVAPETFVYHAVGLRDGEMGEFLGKEDFDLSNGFFLDREQPYEPRRIDVHSFRASLRKSLRHAATEGAAAVQDVVQHAREQLQRILETKEKESKENVDNEENSPDTTGSTHLQSSIGATSSSDEAKIRIDRRIRESTRRSVITRTDPNLHRLPDAYERPLHQKVWRVLFQEEFSLSRGSRQHFGGYDYGVFLLSRRAVHARARTWYENVAYGLQSLPSTWAAGFVSSSGTVRRRGSGRSLRNSMISSGSVSRQVGEGATSRQLLLVNKAKASTSSNSWSTAAGRFVSVRTDISSTPRIYNKAICMVFEHLWSVVFGFVAHSQEGDRFTFGYRADEPVTGGEEELVKQSDSRSPIIETQRSASILLKNRFYDNALPLTFRLESHPAARSIVHFENVWADDKMSLLSVPERCAIQHFLLSDPRYYIQRSILPQFPRICYVV
ncbi:unnamed protein product [Amoebophrya sp. A25]|nr:unnamed protein product [Amoebophrya sp. A25]|eukprot:GSA25T00003048001.1